MSSLRKSLGTSKRLVVKVGTRVLSGPSGRTHMENLVEDLAKLSKSGKEIVLVTSGAIGAGVKALGLESRPTELPELQMAAAVGQSKLMSTYDKLFAARGITVGQILLTRDGLIDKSRYSNAQNTLLALIKQNVLPIVNENDTVSAEEICFGDNDILALLAAELVKADTLILLSSTNGLVKNFGSDQESRIPHLSSISHDTLDLAVDTNDDLSLGGMKSKLEAAKQALEKGLTTVIADGRTASITSKVLAGEDHGTLVATE